MKNEIQIRNTLSTALDSLLEKAEFSNVSDIIKTSVDFKYETSGITYLFEVDSNNAAKIVFGQFLLLNKSKELPKKSIFVVIHCYKGYNIERTKKHLEFAKKAYNCKIPFVVFHVEEWNKIIVGKSKKEINVFLKSFSNIK